MSTPAAPLQYMLGKPGAAVTAGIGNWMAVLCAANVAVTVTMLGAVSAGTILIEETDDPGDGTGSGGSAALVVSVTAAAGPGKLISHLPAGVYQYLRARISSAIVGGSAYVSFTSA
jgi:hypothetical protein